VTTHIRRLDLGYFVRPRGEAGREPRVEPVLAYLVNRPEGLLVFDTGLGEADAETDAHYRPQRRPLTAALAAAGIDPAGITLVVNCHLHFDHCGGNPALAGTPIIVQRTELAAASVPHYTVPALVDFTGAHYREIDGEAEVWPGVWVIPTPGHTDGHQSLVVRQADGTVVLAGQAHDFAYQLGSALLARTAAQDGVPGDLPATPPWLARLVEFDPRRILFAHDASVWEPC
jgi:N-acyl homoserine lactone hydrolase